MNARPDCPECPVPLLVGPEGAAGRAEEVLARVVDAAWEVPVGDADGRALVRRVLLHLLDHDLLTRPAVAQALVRLAPEQVAQAQARIAGYLADRRSDPLVAADPALVETPEPWERVCGLITLAHLDRSWLPVAEAEYARAEINEAFVAAAPYAGLGPEQGRQAVARLAGYGQQDIHTARVAARYLVRLPAEQHREVRAALDGLLERGWALGLLANPLTALDPAQLANAVHVAITSMRYDSWTFIGTDAAAWQDAVSAVRAAGPQCSDEVLASLWALVRDETAQLAIRRRAATRIREFGEAERAAAEEWLERSRLRGAGPGGRRQLTDGQLRAEVARVWQRIEDQLAQQAPGVLEQLGGPATAAEIAELEGRLGMRLPVDFAASCARHRSVGFGGAAGFDIEHDDLMTLSARPGQSAEEPDGIGQGRGWEEATGEVRWTDDDWRAGWLEISYEPDGSIIALDLDPGPAGVRGQVIHVDQGIAQSVRVKAENWLGLLREFADALAGGRYGYLPEHRALTY
ncbi:SMI1/KNR4 family protein [Kitasatospora sp. NPDC006697]|uniref:SMI1/KNR4 family protein n=1 Tax=Kitasatospora sp. NPDC006697 TaxID=3364020 RepID=UPI0036737BEC